MVVMDIGRRPSTLNGPVHDAGPVGVGTRSWAGPALLPGAPVVAQGDRDIASRSRPDDQHAAQRVVRGAFEGCDGVTLSRSLPRSSRGSDPGPKKSPTTPPPTPTRSGARSAPLYG